MSEYAGKQFVGIDLHRRRSVIVRTTESGEVLESVRILNDVESLDRVIARGGEDPEVVLEATYGWYWAVDALQAAGANVHLAHPLGVKAFEYRRVKNDFRDAADLADLLRMGRLPEAWIAPPATRGLRELVRHRAKLVALRAHCKAEVHAVLAKCGIQVTLSDLFGMAGTALLDRLQAACAVCGPGGLAAPGAGGSGVRDRSVHQLGPGPAAVRPRLRRAAADPGIGPILAAVFVAEIGDVSRFATAPQLACWAGLTPKHHESDTHVHRGRITKQDPGWSAGPRWNRCRCCRPTPGSARSGTGSPPAAAATSAWWRPPAPRSSSSTTRCATIASGRFTHARARHETREASVGRRSCRS